MIASAVTLAGLQSGKRQRCTGRPLRRLDDTPLVSDAVECGAGEAADPVAGDGRSNAGSSPASSKSISVQSKQPLELRRVRSVESQLASLNLRLRWDPIFRSRKPVQDRSAVGRQFDKVVR